MPGTPTSIALAGLAALCLSGVALAQAIRGIDGRLSTRGEVKVFLDQCSQEANARGLTVEDGYRGARWTFRREGMHKLEIDPQR